MSKKELPLWNKIRPILVDGHMKPPVVAELADQLNTSPKTLENIWFGIAKLGMKRQVAKIGFTPGGGLGACADCRATWRRLGRGWFRCG